MRRVRQAMPASSLMLAVSLVAASSVAAMGATAPQPQSLSHRMSGGWLLRCAPLPRSTQ